MLKSLQIVGNSRFGGATRLMLEWSEYLLERGYQVDILCTDERMKDEVQAIRGAGLVDHIYIPKEISPTTDAKAYWQLVSHLRKNSYDVIHTYTATPSFLGRVAATMARVPVVVNHQGGWAVNEMSSFKERLAYTPLEYLATLACTKNICVSNSERQKAIDYGLAPKRKLVTIVNGIDPTPFIQATENGARAEVRQELDISDDTILLGNTGRLVPGKGNESLIMAMSHLRDMLPNNPTVLALAGNGSDRDELTELIRQHNLEDRVQLLGFYAGIDRFLAGIDIFVTPTLTEGLSISLLEAMAAALPVVATEIPANAEVVAHQETGLLVPIDAPMAIAEAVAQYIKDPSLAANYGSAARAAVLEYYTRERMFKETWDLYVDLLGPSRQVGLNQHSTSQNWSSNVSMTK